MNLTCAGRQARAIEYFCSKPAMDIEGLSEKTIAILIKHQFIQNFFDLFQLADHRAELLTLARFGEKKS